MKRVIIDITKFDGFKTDLCPLPEIHHYDYRVHLTKIRHNDSANGNENDIILDTGTQKVIKFTSTGSVEYPIEKNVVYLNTENNANNLVIWNGVELEEIGTSTNDNDIWNSGTYVIATDIYQNVIMGGSSTLIFEGGVFWTGLQGNHTAIQAPPVRIFGDNIILTGTFVNKAAYPEWWGAVSSPNNIHDSSTRVMIDNQTSIQNAFDSCFGEIEFCCGNYYVMDSITLRKMKTIKMQGLGLRTNTSLPNDFTTVLWTDKNIDVLIIDILDSQAQNGRLLIEGGEINVSECKGDAALHDNVWINNIDYPLCYTSNAILFYPTGEWGGKISLSLVGPIPYVGRTNGVINWSGTNCHCPTEDEVNHNYKGTGVRFTSNEQSSLDYPTAYVFTLDCFILGFGQGIAIDYSADDDADITSLHVYGVIDQCFTYLNSPSRGFNGGVFEPTIQARNFNTPDGYNKALIIGNFINAYINPYIWDTSVDFDFFDFDENTKNVSFGSRVISAMNNQYQRMGMSTRDLAAAISGNQSRLLGSMGNFDLQQLSCVNTSVQSDNYTHFIDNDLLGIDKIFNVECNVKPKEFTGTVEYSNSIFSREGMSFSFGDTADNLNAKLTITCNLTQTYTGYPANATRLQLLAIHLKGTAFNYFEEMQLSVNGEVYFNGSYIDIPLYNGLNDIIIPFMRRNNYDTNSSTYMKDNFFLGEIILEFNRLRINSNIWGNERFKVAIEGRLNRHFKNNVWSAAGGDLGNHIMLRGKPYIIGNGNYTSLSALPSDASIGAIAVVNGMYPVIKTTQGWMIQNLSGTSSSLQALNLSIGPMTLGQMAIATNLNKIVWWDNNNNYWRDAMGNPV